MITTQSIITRITDSFLMSELGNELVIMNTQTGVYLGLNEVSVEIYKQAENPIKVEDLILKLVQLYDVSLSDCEAQTIECLEMMLSKGLVKID